jgi:AAA+ ATPase superfamily predicted ATPase
MVDRESEAATLRSAVETAPSLVVLIGRRRVGKSFLLAHALGRDRVVNLQGDEQDESQHLALLAEEAGRRLIGSTALSFGSWDIALTFLGEQAARDPLTVVLDEFQWLKSAQPALDSIIQRHWDAWDRDRVPITLVLSGSALTLMERMLDQGAPLYGRATARPRLAPLDFRQAAAFADTQDPVERLRRWAVVGGTPQYNLWAGSGPLEQVIRERILVKDVPLYDDPRHLLREGEGIRDPGTYLAILRAIAGGATMHNQISQQARITPNNLGRRLERLEDLGYIAPRSPLERDGPIDRAIYEISDPYFRFWFRYVMRNRSRLETGRVREVYADIAADLDNLMGRAFEQCCRTWVQRYAGEELTGAPQQVGSWWSRKGDVEIDIVGVRQHRYVLIGSCKWRRTADSDVLGDLLEQQHGLGPTARNAKLMIFARERFTEQAMERAAEESVQLLTAADLFSAP